MSGGAASLEREQTWYASKAGVFLFGGPFEINLWDSVGVPSAVKRGNRAGCKPRLFAVGAAGQDYRNAAAETRPTARPGQRRQPPFHHRSPVINVSSRTHPPASFSRTFTDTVSSSPT